MAPHPVVSSGTSSGTATPPEIGVHKPNLGGVTAQDLRNPKKMFENADDSSSSLDEIPSPKRDIIVFSGKLRMSVLY